MTWRAHVQDNDFGRFVKVALLDEHSDGSRSIITLPGTAAFAVVRVADHEALPDDAALPVFPADAIPALFAALSRYLGAVEHPEQLRRDYDAERKRVDRLIDALIGRAL